MGVIRHNLNNLRGEKMVTKEEVFSNLTIKQDAGVPFNRTNPVPLDKHSIFASKDDAVSYATLSATAYPG